MAIFEPTEAGSPSGPPQASPDRLAVVSLTYAPFVQMIALIVRIGKT